EVRSGARVCAREPPARCAWRMRRLETKVETADDAVDPDPVVLEPLDEHGNARREVPASAETVGHFVVSFVRVRDAAERAVRIELELRMRVADAPVEVELIDRKDSNE